MREEESKQKQIEREKLGDSNPRTKIVREKEEGREAKKKETRKS